MFSGSIDKIENGIAYGWVANEKTSQPLHINLVYENEVIGSGIANKFREDLKEAKIHNGNHSFEINIADFCAFHAKSILEGRRTFDFSVMDSSTKNIILVLNTTIGGLKRRIVAKNNKGIIRKISNRLAEQSDFELLRGVQHVIDYLVSNPVFDFEFYKHQTNIDFINKESAVEHFLGCPKSDSYDPHPLFSVDFYHKKYKDIEKTPFNPFLHFLAFGGLEGRDPSILFKTSFFLSQLSGQEKKNAELSPLEFFIENPKSAKPFALYDHDYYEKQLDERIDNALLDYLSRPESYLSLHSLFDAKYYIDRHKPEAELAFVDYMSKSEKSLSIHPLFNVNYYRARHPSAVNSGLGPHEHYVLEGAKKYFWPNPYFWPEYYCKQVGCVKPTYQNTFEHFIIEGEASGFKPNPWFDPKFYYEQYSFVKASNQSALAHYIQDGWRSDFLPSATFFPKFVKTRYNVPKTNDTLHYYMEVNTGKPTSPPDAWIDDVPEFEQMEFVKKALSKQIAGKEVQVSVVVPVYNNFAYTLRCVYSMLRSADKTSYEIIIADDLSSDLTQEFFGELEGICYVRNSENLGFLRSCNNAATKANGKYIFLLNNDTAVLDGWLDSLVQVIKEPSVGLVGSKLLYPNGILQEAGGIIWSNGAANYGKFSDPKHPRFNFLRNADYISGAAILVKTDIWNTLGGFDERFAPAYCEDSDLCLSIKNLGFEVKYQPGSQIVHFEGISSGTDINSGVKKYQVINSKKLEFKWQHLLNGYGSSNDFSRHVVDRAN